MSAAPTAAAQGIQPNPTPTGGPNGSRAGCLLALVRKLIDYGRELAATLQRDPAARPRQFGTAEITLVLARVARALHLAQALEERLVRNAARLDAPPKPRRVASPRAAAAAPCEHESDPPPAALPTAEQIAAEVRRRPIGAVLADICRDLGILPSHPLWRELSELVVKHGGSLTNLLTDTMRQAAHGFAQHWVAAGLPAGPFSPSPATDGTGPP
jgi:hypothetical protein